MTDLGAVQRFIKPHCPWTNGKAERLNQTLAYEWAYATVFESSDQRVASLGGWLHGYNHHRPHTALAGYPPIKSLPVASWSTYSLIRQEGDKPYIPFFIKDSCSAEQSVIRIECRIYGVDYPSPTEKIVATYGSSCG